MIKGNKYGVTKDQTRYGDMAQPKHTNEWEYHENQPPSDQGTSPAPATTAGGSSSRPSMKQDNHPEHNMPASEYDGQINN